MRQFFFLLIFIVLTAYGHAAAESQSHEVPYKSRIGLSQVLGSPRYLLRVPWIPIRRFLNYSERTDFFARVRDFFYFNEDKTFGWFPKISSGGSGEGVGASIFHHNLFDKKHQTNLALSYAGEEEYFFRSTYLRPQTDLHPVAYKLDIQFYKDQEIEVFTRSDPNQNPVLGIHTDQRDEKDYTLRTFRSSLRIERKIKSFLKTRLKVQGETSEATDPRTGVLPRNLIGLNETLTMIGGEAGFTLDLRNHPVRPSRGFYLFSSGKIHSAPKRTGSGRKFGFVGYEIRSEQFIPVYEPGRILVFRQSIRRVAGFGSREIPFYHLPILDVNHHLRSFERNRFQDEGSLSFGSEYRYPIWVTWDAYLFIDAGQTFGSFSSIESRQLRFSEGVGIRFLSKDKLMFILQWGTGREGSQVLFTLGQSF